MSLRTEYEIWRAELAGERPNRSSWILVALGVALVAVALAVMR